jgi:hypothetical protein
VSDVGTTLKMCQKYSRGLSSPVELDALRHRCLEFAEWHFDGVQLGRVLRQIEKRGATFNRLAYASGLVRRKNALALAPDFECLARTPWPIASLASSGIKDSSSGLNRSCARNACQQCFASRPSHSWQAGVCITGQYEKQVPPKVRLPRQEARSQTAD